MRYAEIVEARFLRRPNRFIAEVELEGVTHTVHVKNTGRCAELLVPGARVILEAAPADTLAKRRTAYSLIAVYKGELLINMDSQAPNQVVYEAAAAGQLDAHLGGAPVRLRRELTYGRSRFDLYAETAEGRRTFLEVKGVTLEEAGVVRFPDAPTERGAKHVLELIDAVREGYGGVVFFLVQMSGAVRFEPNAATDPAFADALRQAAQAGVQVVAYAACVEPDAMTLGRPVPVQLR